MLGLCSAPLLPWGRDGAVRASCGSTKKRCVSTWDPACKGKSCLAPSDRFGSRSHRTARHRLGAVGSAAQPRAVAGAPSRSVAGRYTAKVRFLGFLAAARSLLYLASTVLVSPCPSLHVPCLGRQEGNFHFAKPLRFSLQHRGETAKRPSCVSTTMDCALFLLRCQVWV